MKRIFTLFIIIISFNLLSAQETYRFRTDMPQGPNIESSTASGLSLHYVLNEITVADYSNGDDKGQEILMKGSFGSFAEGLPNLPFENHYIAVPRGAKVSIKVKENGSQILNGIDLLPAAEVIMNNAAEQPKLRKDLSVFGKDANFPSENVTIAQSTQIRGLDVVMLNITPFRYNPIRKTLEVVYDMDIEISFEGGNGQFGDARYRNPAWDGILRDLVINNNMLPEAHYYERLNEAIQNREEGCEYLIITIDDSAFMAWADTLKQFRTKQGILTKVVTTADCGSNKPEDIRNYILNAYESWGIPPAAVLLFGCNQATQSEFGLQPFIYRMPLDTNSNIMYPTDNPFADMNGDSIPDLAISRMTVFNADDCRLQVKKLIDYELNPPTDSHYYDHPVINSGYQDTKWFAITAQVTNNFLRDKLGKHPSNLYMKYWLEDGDHTPPDSIWSVAPNTDAVLNYFGQNGAQYIPSSIGYLDSWIEMEDKLPFQNAVNEGSFITFYRDHSAPNWWPCSTIQTRDVRSYHNERPTFFFSIGCSTNNYWDNWSYEDDCIVNMFLHAETGAIGSLGANTVTYSHYNDLTTWGMFDYLWPDYMPTLGSQTEPDFSYPSYSLVAGKLFLRQQTFLPYTIDTVKVEKTLNLFSYLGETYLNLFTEMPQPLAIEAPVFHANDQWQYTFTAEEGATVCLSSKNGIIAIAHATGESQSLTLPQMEVGEQFIVTVTKQNHFRSERTVTIIPSEHSFVYAKAAAFNDHDGNGQLDYGEYSSFDLELHNAGRHASKGSQITLLCESPYISLLQDAASYHHIEPDSLTTLNNVFRIQIANDIPDKTTIHFGIRFDDEENTHTDYFEFIAHAPILQIESEFSITDAEGSPSTHILSVGTSLLSFNVINKGSAKSQAVNTQIEIKAPFLSVEEPRLLTGSIEPNDSLRITFPVVADGTELLGAWPQIQLKLQHQDTEFQIDTIIQYSGVFENFETDTLSPLFQWATSGNHSWVHYEDDAYEGNGCLISRADTINRSRLLGRLKVPTVTHRCKISFHYKTGEGDTIQYTIGDKVANLSSKDWQYAEFECATSQRNFNYTYKLANKYSAQAKIDNLCFPPIHTTIAYAGNDLIACDETSVELKHAYAYDCNSITWMTEGDGHFDYDTIANPTYYPGNQDLANGSVILTLSAFGNDTVISSTQIHFVDEICLTPIVGDAVVNKYSNPVSHYSVAAQEGINYLWQLEPAEAGAIYNYGNEIDILWYLNEGDADVTLSVTADNGCDVEPITKTISLIGYSIPEWQSVSFDLYPNPTDGNVNLVMGDNLQGKALIEVYNLLGERMMAKSVHHLQKNETVSLDLSNLVSGLYIIKLSTENGSCSKKVSVR